MTNYENLLLTIETDGTISPKEAIDQATKILIDHFDFIAGEVGSISKPIKQEKKDAAKDVENIEDEIIDEKDEDEKPAKKEKKVKKTVKKEKK